jgi:DNA polymerase-3 subunit epsilon
MFAPQVRFVDVETTGMDAGRERIIEIGVVAVDVDGDAIRVDEWSTLVNPQRPVPSEIRWLTGIDNEMLRAAPPFAAIADELIDRLRGALFVAHNARFDYGFLRAEFARAGFAWRAPTLCTVRLSRMLYPDRAPHSLDAIIDRFGIDGEQRHRALGDARALWRFVDTLYRRLRGPRSTQQSSACCRARARRRGWRRRRSTRSRTSPASTCSSAPIRIRSISARAAT